MTKRFERAYNALVDAFFNGTLASGTCTACAVGNIVAACQGGKIRFDGNSDRHTTDINGFSNSGYVCSTNNSYWGYFMSSLGRGLPIANQLLQTLWETTGYTWEELAMVEKAFEGNTKISAICYEHFGRDSIEVLEDQYNGLVAAVDVLLKLDGEQPDPQYAQKFREHPKLQAA